MVMAAQSSRISVSRSIYTIYGRARKKVKVQTTDSVNIAR